MTESLRVRVNGDGTGGGDDQDFFKLTMDQTLMPQPSSLDRNEGYVAVTNTKFVALIVGKNGQKIREIRERTGTIIEFQPPIFRIGGTAQNVAKAVKEIKEIVKRLKNQYRLGAFLSADSAITQSRITMYVPVPSKFVGLVVGFQGSTVMAIQHQSRTHIQTPAHGGKPIFQVTGAEQDVYLAKLMIHSHIEQRTGLSALDIATLLCEQIDANWLDMLQNYGLSATINAINGSQVDMSSSPSSDSQFCSASSSSYVVSPEALSSTSSSDPINGLTMTFEGLNTDRSDSRPWTGDNLDFHRMTDLIFFGGEVEQQHQQFHEPRRNPRPILNSGAASQPFVEPIQPSFNAFTVHPISSFFPDEYNDHQANNEKTVGQPTRVQSLNFAGAGASNFWGNLALLGNLSTDQVL